MRRDRLRLKGTVPAVVCANVATSCTQISITFKRFEVIRYSEFSREWKLVSEVHPVGIHWAVAHDWSSKLSVVCETRSDKLFGVRVALKQMGAEVIPTHAGVGEVVVGQAKGTRGCQCMNFLWYSMYVYVKNF